MLLFQKHTLRKLGLLGLIGVLIFSANISAQEVDVTVVGVSVGDKFTFKVEKNNLTHPSQKDHLPLYVERNNELSPAFEQQVTFTMKIDQISGEDINTIYSDGKNEIKHSGKLNVVHHGLIIANDWDYWNSANSYTIDIAGEELYKYRVGLNWITTEDLGETFVFTETVSGSSAFDGSIKQVKETVTYDKNTGVVKEIKILKQFVGDGFGVEEASLTQIPNESEDSSLPGQSFFMSLGILVAIGILISKKRGSFNN
ncbi:MAG: hypothetical protein GPJ54_09075 [Candidatus Heimdallarchaeota archaeon]|nr:hypothetical protein [Candidatus Heimdallarchaeota archaeon]